MKSVKTLKKLHIRYGKECLEIVGSLPDVLGAERNANWNSHLETFRQMLINDLAYDHLNYISNGEQLHWYIDMMQSRQIIHQQKAYFRGFHTYPVARFPASSIVYTDMALEQLMNHDT